MKTKDLYSSKNLCCGCSACVSICPHQAIFFVIDEEGFEYPEIDSEICIDCKLCVSTCPINSKLIKSY